MVYQGLPVKNIFKADFLIQSSGKAYSRYPKSIGVYELFIY